MENVEKRLVFTLRSSLAWIFGVVILICGAASIVGSPIAGILLILSSLLILPPVMKFISNKCNIHLSKNLRVVFAVILLVIGFSITGKSAIQSTDISTNNQEQTAQTEAVTQDSQKTYQEVFSFSGIGTKKSEPFIITGSRFKISYDCVGSYCGATLYRVGSNVMSSVIMNSAESVKDETIIYGSGEYYIDVIGGNFNMTVLDYK